jgi:hypothetical protein
LGLLIVRRCLVIAAILLWALPAQAQMLLSGGTQTAPAGDPITTMLASMVSGQSKKLTGASAGNFAGVLLARTRADFDGDSTWVNDAAVNQNAMAGIGPATVASVMAFSAPTVCVPDDVLMFSGGGHSNNGDSSVLIFDAKAAASSINGGGAGGNWSLLVKSAEYLPSASAKPVWSNQTAATGTFYWATTNADGINRNEASHTYWYMTCIPGSTKAILSGLFPFSSSADGTIGQAEIIDYRAGTVSFIQSASTANGLIQANCPLALNDLDSAIYCWSSGLGDFHIYKWTNPLTSPTLVTVVGTNNQTPVDGAHGQMVVIPDVVSGTPLTKRAIFMNNLGAGNFAYYGDIGNGCLPGSCEHDSNAFSCTPTNTAGVAIGWDYDTNRGRLVSSDGGGTLAAVTPNASLSTWCWQPVLTLTGDIPTANTSGNFVRLKYDPTHDCYFEVAGGGFTGSADVWIIKP